MVFEILNNQSFRIFQNFYEFLHIWLAMSAYSYLVSLVSHVIQAFHLHLLRMYVTFRV